MNGNGDHQIEWDKSSSERQILHVFTHVKPRLPPPPPPLLPPLAPSSFSSDMIVKGGTSERTGGEGKEKMKGGEYN
jgi:hypothetical protein